MLLGLALGIWSTAAPIRHGTDAAAMRGYRPAVHASALAMMSLGSAALGVAGAVAAGLVSVLLTERAFRRSANP
jgi:hypothetical protein